MSFAAVHATANASTRFTRTFKQLALCAALALAWAAPAHAAEVAPQMWLGQVLTISQLSGGDPEFSCVLTAPDADGDFSCGSDVNGRIVGITNQFGIVTGHRIRFTRRISATVTESYVGAVAIDESGYSTWMAGEFSVTTLTRSCSAGRCVTFQSTSGPFPFTGRAVNIGG